MSLVHRIVTLREEHHSAHQTPSGRIPMRHYGRAGGTKAWAGPVERRDPASVRTESIHLTWMCPGCRSWAMHGAYLVGRCNFCGTQRPA